MILCGVSEATLARSLIGHTVGALEAWKMTESNHSLSALQYYAYFKEGGLTTLSDWVDAVGIKASRG